MLSGELTIFLPSLCNCLKRWGSLENWQAHSDEMLNCFYQTKESALFLKSSKSASPCENHVCWLDLSTWHKARQTWEEFISVEEWLPWNWHCGQCHPWAGGLGYIRKVAEEVSKQNLSISPSVPASASLSDGLQSISQKISLSSKSQAWWYTRLLSQLGSRNTQISA